MHATNPVELELLEDLNLYSVGIDFSHQNPTSKVDPHTVRVISNGRKLIP